MQPQPGDQGRPVYTNLTIASNFAAFHGAMGVVMVLFARERDGLGQRIEVPLFSAMFDAIGGAGLKLPSRPARGGVGRATYREYQCKDGRWIFFGGLLPRFQEWLLEAAGERDACF
jgi:crotonobetainyl-CoA:carnitine CoA-transferase CaiB-like acyl-CoA transferase